MSSSSYRLRSLTTLTSRAPALSASSTVGQLGGQQADAHAIACAKERGWPLLTAEPARYARYQQIGVELEPVI
jgi:hypothetical protein